MYLVKLGNYSVSHFKLVELKKFPCSPKNVNYLNNFENVKPSELSYLNLRKQVIHTSDIKLNQQR